MRIYALCALLAQIAAAAEMVRIAESSREVRDEYTAIKVHVSVDSFLIGKTEVTQAEYSSVAGTNPSHQKGDRLPVESVSWWDAIRFCNKLSIKERLQPCYDEKTGICDRSRNGYRLPTEAEWLAAAGPMPNAKSARPAANLGNADSLSIPKLLDRIQQGLMPVASFPAGQNGVHDLLGNVWEWCNDWNDAVAIVSSAHNPQGPPRGVERVIRGGSFATSTNSWSGGYRSSLDPTTRSRYTGFRICRTAAAKSQAPQYASDWFGPFNQIPTGFDGEGKLTPLPAVATAAEWRKQAARLHEKWEALLGSPKRSGPPPRFEPTGKFTEPSYEATDGYLWVEPNFRERVCIVRPPHSEGKRLPVVIVPYYDVDAPVGHNLGGKRFTPIGTRSYAYLAAQRGWMAIAIRWFGQSYGETAAEAVANLALRHPGWTGMGKWTWDAHGLVDYIRTRTDVDPDRIGIIGHSLGGKLALYAAAMDDRIRVTVSSEPGIGFSFSNYQDYWYLGDKIASAPPGTDQHELLALLAPRPFLLIAGDSADKDASWNYIHAVRPIYKLFGDPRRIGLINHRTGHSPTPEAVERALDWLERWLNEP